MSIVERLVHGDYQVALGIITILSGTALVLFKAVPKIPLLNRISFVPFLFFVPMLFSNIGLIPIQHDLYEPLQSTTLHFAIFLMVVTIDVRNILKVARPQVLLLFLLGCGGTVLGGIIAWAAFIPLVGTETAAQVAAGTTGFYCGGSMNWAAVCDALDVPFSLNAAAFPAVIIVYSLYLGFILLLEGSPWSKRLERWLGAPPTGEPNDNEFVQKEIAPLSISDYITGVFAFCGAYLLSILLEQAVATYIFIPQVIFLTTFALILGAWTPLHAMRGLATLGEAALYFLLCVIGTQGDLRETLQQAPILILLTLIVAVVHGVVILFSARILKVDLTTTCVTSVASIGGAATAPIVAAVFKVEELIPIGVLLGLLGYAVGNYLGIYLGHTLLQLSP